MRRSCLESGCHPSTDMTSDLFRCGEQGSVVPLGSQQYDVEFRQEQEDEGHHRAERHADTHRDDLATK